MIDAFGYTNSGDLIQRIALKGERLSLRVITYGATIQDMFFEGHRPPLVLGFNALGDYEAQPFYTGAVVGRCANRISKGRFVHDGKFFELDRNEGGNHLHGGVQGFSKKTWKMEDYSGSHVVLGLVSDDGEMGYPGYMKARCTYRIVGDTLDVQFSASCDAPTLCNLVQHSYFNLTDGGVGTIDDHELAINATHYLPVNDELLPLGSLNSVADTPLDFNRPRSIGKDQNYDHNFCLSQTRQSIREVARLYSHKSGMMMKVETTEPGLQLYTGESLTGDFPGINNIAYKPRSGLCLETQAWPDASTNPGFPSTLLRPGMIYRHHTRYGFSKR